MPAAAVKGIIISISILTALGVAVLENPQIQAWLEQQRQKILELLRTLGEELDPQSRQAAEAFAFQGRTPTDDPGLRREASGSLEAAAKATGRSLSNPSTIRRIPVRGQSDPDEVEERRRKGREYLAQRNQQMYELKERRKAAKAEGASTPPTPTSFDAMVDEEGKLKAVEGENWKGKEKLEELASLPSLDDVPEHIKADMREVERNLVQPLLAGEASSSASAWQLGSRLANPFSDEYALDRSETPKPPVPPKLALDEPNTDSHAKTNLYIRYLPEWMNEDGLVQLFAPHKVCACRILRGMDGRSRGVAFARFETHEACEEVIRKFNNRIVKFAGELLQPEVRYAEERKVDQEPQTSTMPGSFTPRQPLVEPEQTDEGQEELSYEEQLAIALSLSEAEAQKAAKVAAQQVETEEDDADLRAAIEASLKDMRNKLAAQSGPATQPRLIDVSQPLVDLTPSPPTAPLYQPAPRGHWETLFNQDYSPTREPLSMAQPIPVAEEEDELYRVTPQLTQARLASHDSQQDSPRSTSVRSNMIPYDPVREAANGHVTEQQLQAAMEASFYSAADSAPAPSPSAATTRSHTMDHEPTPQLQLVDVSEDVVPAEGTRTPISRSSFSFHTDASSDSDSETFASVSAPASRSQSRARSEISNVEVVDLLEDSDVDMLSEEGDGIATPDSWTEVGSRDGESEMDEDEDEHPNRRLVAL